MQQHEDCHHCPQFQVAKDVIHHHIRVQYGQLKILRELMADQQKGQ